MGEPHNTIMCAFAMNSPRITAYNIHEWVFKKLKIPEDDINVLQIDGFRRKVYIKFTSNNKMMTHLQVTQGGTRIQTRKWRGVNSPGENNRIRIQVSETG
jgi:hypothetical protein